MKPHYITDTFLYQFVQSALREDIGDGDHSSLGAIPEQATSRAKLMVKDDGIIAGIELAQHIYRQFDPSLELEVMVTDGQAVTKGDIAFTVQGNARSILTSERLVLNCMQRMSGIATYTSRLVKLVEGTRVQLLDTRKTTPNFRLLEKWAVLIGGGANHRIGLYDSIMLKDNHIDIVGSLKQAIIRTKEYLRARNKDLKIEVETRNLEEVSEVLRIGGVNTIMLDNMTTDQMKQAVKLIAGKCRTEASGGITAETIREVALCGVDYISVGALTHSMKSLDLSLKIMS